MSRTGTRAPARGPGEQPVADGSRYVGRGPPPKQQGAGARALLCGWDSERGDERSRGRQPWTPRGAAAATLNGRGGPASLFKSVFASVPSACPAQV